MSIFKNKNKESLEKYIIENQEKIYRIAYVYLKNKEDSLDIIQDSVIKAYLNINKLKNSDAIDKWFIRLLINNSIDFIRKNSRISYLESEDLEPYLKDEKINLSFEEIIDNLDLELKGIITLKYFYGYKVNEISDILLISESKVKNKLQKALKFLRKEIKEEGF